MQVLGPSLSDLQEKSAQGKLTLKTILMLADQTLKILEGVHSRHIVHCDIKPDNFMVGLGKEMNQVYIIDFGLSTFWYDERKGRHVKFVQHTEGASLTGSPRYASLNAHHNRRLSRRDDLESLGYTLLRLLAGSLPWSGLKREKDEKPGPGILKVKEELSLPELCRRCGAPAEFGTYLKYCRALAFDATPDYNYLRGLFRNVMRRENLMNDSIFDWIQKDAASASQNRRASVDSRKMRRAPSIPKAAASVVAAGRNARR